MIKEIAIDPDVLLEWSQDRRDYREFKNEYGVGTPRIISSFPKTKYKNLRKYLLRKTDYLSSDMDKSRYVSMIEMLENNIYLRDSEVDSNEDWQDLVLNEQKPFDIVVSNKRINCPNFIHINDIYTSGLLDLKKQKFFKRNQNDFINVVNNFIKLTNSQLIIIDPYAWKSNSRKLIIKLIKEIYSNLNNEKNINLQIYYKDNPKQNVPIASFYRDLLLKELGDISDSIKVSVFHVAETSESEAFHNRYILNDIGGVMLGHGLDISSIEEDTNKRDVATLLEKDLRQHLLRQFRESSTFKIISHA